MIEEPVKKQHLHIVKATPADLPVARAKDAFTQPMSSSQDLTQALTLTKPPRRNQDALLMTEEPSIFFPFPAQLANLIQGLSLPLPTQPMTEGMSTLVAWTESDHPALKQRVTDFLLMILAEGEEVHPNPELPDLWQNWHRTTEPIERLALLVREGEEPAALRALVGRPAPGPETAAALTDILLERWKGYVLVQAPSDRPVQKKKQATLIDFRTSLRRRGIRTADIWIDRLLLSILTARQLGHILILSGPTRIGLPLVTEVLADAIEGVDVQSIRLPRRKTHLLGRMDREKNIFQFSQLTQAARAASKRAYAHHDHDDYLSPSLVLIEDISTHAKGDSLHTLIQQARSENGVLLFSEEENKKWIEEYEQLHCKEELNIREEERRDLLEQFFAQDALGGRPADQAWRLHMPENMVVMGVLDTHRADKKLELLSQGIVLVLPELDLEDIERGLQTRLEARPRFNFSEPSVTPEGTWERFPKTRERLLELIKCLSGCNLSLSPELSAQISSFLAFAESWGLSDGPLLVSHIAQALILPRILCQGSEALEAFEQILELPELSPDLLRRLSQLRNSAIQYRRQPFHGAMRWES
ncbi:MAG: hypothetical protein CMK59_11320 [Proteobacteria bacterium]|nr:hypothetical protein [Pseudomonadota bacterium]